MEFMKPSRETINSYSTKVQDYLNDNDWKVFFFIYNRFSLLRMGTVNVKSEREKCWPLSAYVISSTVTSKVL